MNPGIVVLSAILLYTVGVNGGDTRGFKNPDSVEVASSLGRRQASISSQSPIGKPGLVVTYRHESGDAIPGSLVKNFTLALGPLEEKNGRLFQWLLMHAAKANGELFSVWILTDRYPPAGVSAAREATARYILQEGTAQALEFRHRFSGDAVLPSLGAWGHLWPRAAEGAFSDGRFAEKTRYLGNRYVLEKIEDSNDVAPPANVRILELLPDVLIGVPSNTRQKDETRRYDDSDYELIRLTKNDYDEMIEAGMNCL